MVDYSPLDLHDDDSPPLDPWDAFVSGLVVGGIGGSMCSVVLILIANHIFSLFHL
jgi:hypothetical protein